MRHVHYGGVDVGGARKGFHVAVLAEASGALRLVDRPRQIPEPAGVVARWRPGPWPACRHSWARTRAMRSAPH